MKCAQSLLFLLATGAQGLRKAALPDPHCHTGVLSLANGTGSPQACCAGYCDECSDYPTCKSVRGQDSTNACCKSNVLAMECGKGAAANVCLKLCTEAVPPCIMPDGTFSPPDPSMRQAGDDCNKAPGNWSKKAAAAMDGFL